MAQKQPTATEMWIGHAVVAVLSSIAVHKCVKGPVWVSVMVGSVIGVAAHDYFDAPVSQVVAALAP